MLFEYHSSNKIKILWFIALTAIFCNEVKDAQKNNIVENKNNTEENPKSDGKPEIKKGNDAQNQINNVKSLLGGNKKQENDSKNPNAEDKSSDKKKANGNQNQINNEESPMGDNKKQENDSKNPNAVDKLSDKKNINGNEKLPGSKNSTDLKSKQSPADNNNQNQNNKADDENLNKKNNGSESTPKKNDPNLQNQKSKHAENITTVENIKIYNIEQQMIKLKKIAIKTGKKGFYGDGTPIGFDKEEFKETKNAKDANLQFQKLLRIKRDREAAEKINYNDFEMVIKTELMENIRTLNFKGSKVLIDMFGHAWYKKIKKC